MAAVLIAVVRLEQAQISAQQFCRGIAGQGFEGWIRVNDGVVGALGIDQYHALRRTLDQTAVQVRIKPRHGFPPSAPAAASPQGLRLKIPSAATAGLLPD